MADDGAPARAHHWHLRKNLLLLCLSLAVLPLSTAVMAAVGILHRLARLLGRDAARRHDAPSPTAGRRTVLVTGVSMAKGLATARLLHRQGHRVVAADCHRLAPARASTAVHKTYTLPQPAHAAGPAEQDPYVRRLLDIVRAEGVHLWISVSDVTAAVQDARARDVVEARTAARAVQLPEAAVGVLHDKARFVDHVGALGLDVPETRVVASRQALVDFLARRDALCLRPGCRRFLVKPVGVDDVARFDMPLLPLVSRDETLARVALIPFTDQPAFVVQEYIRGPEFCTHALVVRGRVRAFVACPSADLLMHYVALPEDSPLSRKMLAFTEAVAEAGGDDWTGHVSFDFLVPADDLAGKQQDEVKVYPIECNPRVHTAVVLFNDTPELVDEYLNVLAPDLRPRSRPLYPKRPQRYYWIGQDLVEHVVFPAYKLLSGSMGLRQFARSLRVFVRHVWQWKDGTFETWDPWPWWWLYHVYWPLQFVKYMFRGRWHKVNVSTGKIFTAI